VDRLVVVRTGAALLNLRPTGGQRGLTPRRLDEVLADALTSNNTSRSEYFFKPLSCARACFSASMIRRLRRAWEWPFGTRHGMRLFEEFKAVRYVRFIQILDGGYWPE
jgi:hypothetical protein